MDKDIVSATAFSNYQLLIANLLPDSESRLDSMEMKANPIIDSSIPYRDLTSPEAKRKSIYQLIDKLDVENNIRYQKTPEDTYCNVYAYDFCHFCKVYLPTVWWTDESLEKITNGQTVTAIFNQTVERIYSSALTDWFSEWGIHFGWEKINTVEEIQNKVNSNGGVGIICAKRKVKGLSGHIVPVVPETDLHKAYRENGTVLYPLQSQAGLLNYNYFSEVREDWWNDELYAEYVFYYHD